MSEPESHRPPQPQNAWNEESLRLAHRIARVGSWEWDLETGRLSWSEMLSSIYGLEAESLARGFDDFVQYVMPEDRDHLNEVLETAIADATPFQVEYRVRRPEDGEVRHILARGENVRVDPDTGRSLRMIGTAQDITEQKESARRELNLIREQVARARAEADLQFLERVFLSAPALVLITRGREHLVELTNPRLRSNFGERSYLDRSASEVLPDLVVEGEPLTSLLDSVLSSGTPFDGTELTVTWEARREPGDGRGVFDVLIQPLAGSGGDVTGLSVYMVDVTDHVTARRDAEQKAEELARLTRELARTAADLDQFAYVASHDLKAPLRGIANLSQWIEEDLEEAGVELPEDTAEHLELLRGRVHRMEALIDGLLSYSRAGRVRGETEAVDVGELVAEVVDLLDPPEEMTVVADGPFPTLDTERLPLSQVFHNLIGNAVKFGASRVEVTAESRPDGWRFSVTDDGPGIPPEYEHKIWIMFQTLHPRDEIEGTGIGLALVKKLVEAQGGKVWVTSAPDAGATFTFHWPTGRPSRSARRGDAP